MSIGPFTIVDADTNQTVFYQRAKELASAFKKGDKYAQENDRDYRVLDRFLNPVTRPKHDSKR